MHLFKVDSRIFIWFLVLAGKKDCEEGFPGHGVQEDSKVGKDQLFNIYGQFFLERSALRQTASFVQQRRWYRHNQELIISK